MKTKLRYTRAQELVRDSGRNRRWYAERIGIKHDTLKQYLIGNSQPSYTVVSKLADLLEVSVTEIWIGEVDSKLNRTKGVKKPSASLMKKKQKGKV